MFVKILSHIKMGRGTDREHVLIVVVLSFVPLLIISTFQEQKHHQQQQQRVAAGMTFTLCWLRPRTVHHFCLMS